MQEKLVPHNNPPSLSYSKGVLSGTLPKYAYWGVLSFALILFNSFHQLDSDEGVVLEGAWGILQGRDLYTDSFQYIAPGSFYVVAWLWQLVTPDYYLAKIFSSLAIIFTSLAIYRTSLLVLSEKSILPYFGPAVYCMASVLWPTINHNTFNVFWMAWAMYYCTKATLTRSLFDYVAAGMTTGISVLFLQHKGVAFFLPVLFLYLGIALKHRTLDQSKGPLLYAFSFLLPLAVFLRWPLSVLYEQLIDFPRHNYLEVNKVSSLPLIIASIYVAMAFLSLRNRLTNAVALLFVIQISLLLTSVQRTDISHVLIVMFPLVALTPLVFLELKKTNTLRLASCTYAGLAIGASILISIVAILVINARTVFYDATKEGFKPLFDYLAVNCPSFYAGPFLPGLYFEAKKTNPLSFQLLLSNFNTVPQFDKARRELEASPPRCAVVDYRMVEKFGYKKQNPVDDFIENNYLLSQKFGAVEIYMLSERATKGSSSLNATPRPLHP